MSVWSPQQEFALAALRDWLKDPHGPQVFYLAGFAGTGKTTLAKEVRKMVRGQVLYGAFTGKAALVLDSKGCTGASTLHSLCFIPERDHETGQFIYTRNPDSPIAEASLLVVDEVSMVDEFLGGTVLSFNTRVLVLGDPAQLPPVKGQGFFTARKPDVMLTEIHRQALDNPIVQLTLDIRQGKRIQPGRYGETEIIDRRTSDRHETWNKLRCCDQLLVGLNKTRVSANNKLRRDNGLVGEDSDAFLPVVGDRAICLKNDREMQLLNGMMFEVLDAQAYIHAEGLPVVDLRVKSLDQPGRSPVDVTTPAAFYDGTEAELDWRAIARFQQFTHGWAITVHKSQGSQWSSVGIIDESAAFKEHAKNHIYTAITRAAERAVVVV